uniref:Hyaluronidase n=1 Tax=Cyprinus carpio TaxID=7962 RepID=A0A8C2H0Y5_CYPCA
MKNVTGLFGATRPPRVSWLRLLFLMLFWTCLKAQQLKNSRWPLYSGKPLLLAWNAPTEDCRPRHNITFQLDQFQIVASPNEGFTKQNLTIFYQDRLGLYPYFEPDGTPVNGGLPQVASLTQHLERMPEGLKKYIKDTTVKGLAVIDWEEWRPLWIRNWGTKDIYRNGSRRLVAEKNPTWPQDQVAKVAQQEFELSARKFMLETLRSAKSLRPHQLWGFYLFPDCYNHNYKNKSYTGHCPDVELKRNNELQWLWTESTALYPSIYMANVLKDQPAGRQFVRNRVKEGMRLASVGNGSARPVFIYTRPTYQNNAPASNGNPTELPLLTETDLVSTIGESVALGVAGVILWGDSNYASSHMMNFFRNRLVVLGLVLLATVLLYLLLPSMRQGSMEPSLEVQQRMGLIAASPPPPPPPNSVNITVRTGQLPGDPPLFFREALPVDSAGRQIVPRLQLVLLHGQAFTSKTWEELGTLSLLASNGYQALALDLPGFGNSPDSESVKSDQSRVDLLKRFLESLGVRAPVLLSPSMSGHYALPFLQKHSAQLHGFVPIAPVGTRGITPQQYRDIQTPTLVIYGELDTNLGAQSHKNLIQLSHHTVVKLAGARHACYMDKPREFHRALLDFLSKLE